MKSENIDTLNQPDVLSAEVEKITRMLDMKILGKGPQMFERKGENPGFSVFTIIDFSHICIHTSPEKREVSVDLFSCASFDYQSLSAYVQDAFHVTRRSVMRALVTPPDLNGKALKEIEGTPQRYHLLMDMYNCPRHLLGIDGGIIDRWERLRQ